MNSIPSPKPKVEKPTKGKISRNWRNDPVIMARLTVVAELMLRRASAHQIAQAVDGSLATAKRDIARVRTLWKEHDIQDVQSKRDESEQQYRFIQLQAWNEFTKTKSHRYLQLVLEAQGRIDDLLGLKKAPVQSLNVNLSKIKPTEEMTDDELAAIAYGAAAGWGSDPSGSGGGTAEAEAGESKPD